MADEIYLYSSPVSLIIGGGIVSTLTKPVTIIGNPKMVFPDISEGIGITTIPVNIGLSTSALAVADRLMSNVLTLPVSVLEVVQSGSIRIRRGRPYFKYKIKHTTKK